MRPPVFRFAPSPNGYLHLGHAHSALLNAEMARAMGGEMLLRIEDIDASRSRPHFEQAIYQDLAWLGVRWKQPVRRQSEHFADYGAALRRLHAAGLVYPSFESRSEMLRMAAACGAKWPRDPDGAPLYAGTAKQLSATERAQRIANGEPYALRLDLRAALAAAEARGDLLQWSETGAGPAGESGRVTAHPGAWGDVVLARKAMPTSYHLSVVIDDAAQGVTHVVRGQDLFWSTSVHRLLQALLRLPTPTYHHHRLLRDAQGRKLSKSTLAPALRDLRAAGMSSPRRRAAG